MPQIEMTYTLAMAAARDAGNRHMRVAGRTKWAVADWNHACETLARLWPRDECPVSSARNVPSGQQGAGMRWLDDERG